jgi:hypothetical protein
MLDQPYVKDLLNTFYTFAVMFLGVGWNWVHCLTYCTGPRRWVRMSVEQTVEWIAVETNVSGENLPQYHFVHHKSHKALRTDRALLPRNIFSASGIHFCYGLSKPQGIVRLEGSGEFKEIIQNVGLEPATFRYVALCLNHYICSQIDKLVIFWKQ